MQDIAREAELEKLARLLQTERETLDFLEDTPPDALRTIRLGLTDALFEKFRPVFAGFARMSTLLPLAIGARISQHVLGPVLGGRIAGEMPPERAMEMAERLSDEFLADTCVQMEPTRAQPMIRSFPVARSVAITRLLLARGEYITMGQFVDVLPEKTLLAATDVIESPLALLRIAFFVEDSDQLARVVAHLSTPRRSGVIRAAAEHDLWPAVLDTLDRIDPATRSELAAQALNEDESILDSLIRSAAAHDLWPHLLALGATLDDSIQARFAGQPAFDEAEIICSVADSVVAHQSWTLFERQVRLMGVERAAAMLAVCASQRPAAIAGMAGHFELADDTCAVLVAGSQQLTADQRQAALEAAGPDTALSQLLGQPTKA